MIIPVVCVTCGKILGNKWNWYKKRLSELEAIDKAKDKSKDKSKDKAKDNGGKGIKFFVGSLPGVVLDEMGLDRICCRRHMLTHVDIIDII
jgi:DNA-directed RNA polymerase subunit N (RpoN/RPB10)